MGVQIWFLSKPQMHAIIFKIGLFVLTKFKNDIVFIALKMNSHPC